MPRRESAHEIQPYEFFLKPGFIIVNREDTLVRSVVGNCVAVTLHDRSNHFGGMNHFVFPQKESAAGSTAEYGNASVYALVKMMLEMGADRDMIEAQIIGGASLQDISDGTLGEENVQMARKTLQRLQVPVVSEDVGGHRGRKIIYHTGTNETLVYKVDNLRDSDWFMPGQDLKFDV